MASVSPKPGRQRAGSPIPPYCDLVMKGGITSGLVYPRAVRSIGRAYRFRNIGGTSAGAIAAAFAAAAALGDRRLAAGQAKSGGFDLLEATAAQLSSPGFIFSLFQPVPKARGAFRLLVKFSAQEKTSLSPILFGALLLAPLSFAGALIAFELLGWLIGGVRGMLAAALPALCVAAGFAVLRAANAAANTIRSNFLGMCTGKKQGDAVALTEWMHEQIRLLAGEADADGPPIPFESLWKAPRYPREQPFGKDERALNLEVITTDVSHSEPRTLPFATGTLWFLREEMERLFPPSMVAKGKSDPASHAGKTYHALPAAKDLPIVVAARMSLSFPLLMSAVPLYERHFLKKDDRSRPAESADAAKPLAEAVEELSSARSDARERAAKSEMRLCWFTDGGVSSNFPLQLFDAPMPRWPTFAIDLFYPPPGQKPAKDPIFLPKRNSEGWRAPYTPIARARATDEIGAFLMAIVSTMQNWRDLLQGRAPGHRDRIVQVEIEAAEGGMNLNMPDKVLKALADKGAGAGERLVDEFDFENHFWVRYRNLQASLERFGIRLETAMKAPPKGAQQAYATATKGRGKAPSYPFTGAQSAEAQHRLKDLLQEFETWEDWDGSLTNGAPKPPPYLRIVPIF
jgi:predicted acylesterase/phospholipase RssA